MSKFVTLALIAVLLIIGFLTFRSTQDFLSPKDQFQGTSLFSNWHVFTSPENNFKAQFPSLPQHASQTMEDPKTREPRQYDMFVAEKDDGSVFMISLIKLMNPKLEISEETLKTVMNEIAAGNPDNKMKKMQMGKFKEMPALDYSMENGEVNIDGKAFMVGQTLVLLTTVAKNSSHRNAEFEHFINSFELLAPATPQPAAAS